MRTPLRPSPAARLCLVGCALLVGVGCGDAFYIASQSCSQDFLSWHGGLTHHLVNGPGDGSFDYDPSGLVESRVVGAYDLQTGDFSYQVSYAPTHWRVGTSVTGYGYAKTNGDLDIETTRVTTDILGRTFSSGVRERRTGCDVVRRVTWADDEEWHYGRYERGVYTYRDESVYDGEDWIVEGTLRPDRSYVDRLDYSGSALRYQYVEEGDGDGYARRDFTQVSSGTRYEGIIETFLDGSEHILYASPSGTWDYTIDYRGDGTGTYTQDGAVCTLTFTGGNCRYNCDGSTGQC